MGASASRDDITYSYTDEPHATRRKLILQKYPQVKKLMGVDPSFKWKVLALVAAQILSLYYVRDVESNWLLFLLAYCVGGVANHALMLAVHEISHGAGFGTAKPLSNKVLGMIANLPIGVPMSISFKKYHLEHHRYQGDELLDTDLPSYMEIAFFTNPLRKTLWCLLQPFFYTMRPLFVHPKPLEKMEILNIIVQAIFDYFVVVAFGWRPLIYLMGGSVLAMGLHPVAGHFISEHTLMFSRDTEDQQSAAAAANDDDDDDDDDDLSEKTSSKTQTNSDNNNNHTSNITLSPETVDLRKAKKTSNSANGANGAAGVELADAKALLNPTVDVRGKFLVPETCSYYGPLNWVTFNVGYHVEHHDFPSIPGSRLHLLSKIAPEFYTNLHHHTSWTYVIWRYITDAKVGPFARVRRPYRPPGKSQSVI